MEGERPGLQSYFIILLWKVLVLNMALVLHKLFHTDCCCTYLLFGCRSKLWVIFWQCEIVSYRCRPLEMPSNICQPWGYSGDIYLSLPFMASKSFIKKKIFSYWIMFALVVHFSYMFSFLSLISSAVEEKTVSLLWVSFCWS